MNVQIGTNKNDVLKTYILESLAYLGPNNLINDPDSFLISKYAILNSLKFSNNVPNQLFLPSIQKGLVELKNLQIPNENNVVQIFMDETDKYIQSVISKKRYDQYHIIFTSNLKKNPFNSNSFLIKRQSIQICNYLQISEIFDLISIINDDLLHEYFYKNVEYSSVFFKLTISEKNEDKAKDTAISLFSSFQSIINFSDKFRQNNRQFGRRNSISLINNPFGMFIFGKPFSESIYLGNGEIFSHTRDYSVERENFAIYIMDLLSNLDKSLQTLFENTLNLYSLSLQNYSQPWIAYMFLWQALESLSGDDGIQAYEKIIKRIITPLKKPKKFEDVLHVSDTRHVIFHE